MAKTEDIIQALARDATPVRRTPHPYIVFASWMAVAAAYLALTLVYAGVRPDLMQKLSTPLFLAEIGALIAIVASGSLSTALLAYPDIHQKRKLAAMPIVMLLTFVCLIFLSWLADSPPAPMPDKGLECLLCIASYTLLPAAWMFYALRKYAGTHYYLAGGLALLTAFSLGALSLRLTEQTDSMLHLIQWHYLPMLGVALIGLWLGRLFLKW